MDGEELRRRRLALNLSQEELGRRLEVSRQSVYMWERGETKVPGMVDLALRWLEHEQRNATGWVAQKHQDMRAFPDGEKERLLEHLEAIRRLVEPKELLRDE